MNKQDMKSLKFLVQDIIHAREHWYKTLEELDKLGTKLFDIEDRLGLTDYEDDEDDEASAHIKKKFNSVGQLAEFYYYDPLYLERD